MSENAARFEQLKQRLDAAGIPTDKPGFFDHPAFVAIETRDPSFLDEYARFVHWKHFDSEYLQRAEQIIRAVSDGLYRGLIQEGRLGACIDTSMTMGRILDLYGVWNYVVRGALRLTFPEASGHEPFCFWPVDEDDGSGREYGHKWLVAPPFSIIDITLKLQEYDRPFSDLLPERVLAKTPPTTKGDPEDILCPSAIFLARHQGRTPTRALEQLLPKFVRSFAPDFPAYLVLEPNGVQLKYVPVGIGGSDVPLKRIRSFMVKGRTAFEFYEQEIKPNLTAAGFDETLSESEFPGMIGSSLPSSLPKRLPIALPPHKEEMPSAQERSELRKKRRKEEKRRKRR